MIITIEGNIGSGKTTLLSMIKERLNGYIGRGRRVVYVEEPVKEWESIRDEDGRSMLELLYSDAKTHSFAF
jgi:thymidylate kinase